MTRFALDDALLDGQLLRTAGHSPYGGADLGECIATAGRIDESSLDSWFEEWSATAERVRETAETELAAGNGETARLAFLRASNYYRNAGVMLMGTPIDARLVSSNSLQSDCFRRAAELMALPPEPVEIDLDGLAMPGYFYRAADDGRVRPTLILIGGYDGTVEELYFSNAAAAIARDYNALAFDGPGQGGVLIQHGVPIRADWENVIAPVVDYVAGRPDVDAERIGLIGLSLGAHLAPRAAAGEHRVAACVADCGSFDLYRSFLDRLPDQLAQAFDAGDAEARKTVGDSIEKSIDEPTAGWSMRRGLMVHGAATPLDLIDAMREFSLAGRAEKIECPTWICSAEDDPISASAPELYSALRVDDREHVVFTAEEGANDHCEGGARLLYHARSFGWLDRILDLVDSDNLPPRQTSSAAEG